VRTFGKMLRAAGPDAVGLFYYAGHGIQSRGSNFLLPVTADVETEADLRIAAFSASDVLAQMEEAGNRISIVILDACRNNPLQSRFRSGGRGLARIDTASGSLVAFAAAPGQIAADGASGNSPYTAALASAMRQPGLTVEQVFKKVRVQVETTTGGTQTPWEESSLRGDFYFSGERAAQSAPAPVVVAPQADREVVFWNSVKDTGNAALLQTYVDKYPAGTFSGLARVMIEQLRAADGTAGDAERKIQVVSRTEPAETEPERPDNPADMVILARRYETGRGVAADPAQAAHWYGEAAAKGNVEARYRLGMLRYHGKGVGRDYGKAAEFLLGAVEEDYRPAVDALTNVDVLDDPEFLMVVQRRLKAMGHYRSAIDGEWGPGSRRAIAALAGHAPDVVEPRPRRERRQRVVSPRREEARPRGGIVDDEPVVRNRGYSPSRCRIRYPDLGLQYHLCISNAE